MTNIPALIDANAKRWASMKLDPGRISTFQSIASRLCLRENKVRFQTVTARLATTGFPAASESPACRARGPPGRASLEAIRS